MLCCDMLSVPCCAAAGAQTGVLSVGLPVSVSVQVNAEPEADVLARGGNSGPDSW